MNDRVFKQITETIIRRLEEGVVPWHQPWSSSRGDALMNLVSKRPYRGVNVWLLLGHGYSSPFWVTFRQAKSLGGHVRKGEKGTPVIFWRWIEVEDNSGDKDDAPPKKVPLARHYVVFNSEQCDGIEVPVTETENDVSPIERCEDLWRAMPNRPDLTHAGDGAYYRPSTDVVNVPSLSLFDSAEEYYSTLYHELTHATGHESRLDRWKGQAEVQPFGSEYYSKEELIAEMGAAFLCGMTGINPSVVENQAAYIGGWIERLQNEHRLVVHAAGTAQKAADYIGGLGSDAGVL